MEKEIKISKALTSTIPTGNYKNVKLLTGIETTVKISAETKEELDEKCKKCNKGYFKLLKEVHSEEKKEAEALYKEEK